MGLETVVGLALAAAGTGMQMAAASQSRRAMNDQMVKQVRQQEEFQRQATPIAQEGITKAGPDKGRLSDLAATSKRQYSDLASAPTSGRSPLPVDTTRAKMQINQQQDAAAGGEAYKDVAVDNAIRNQGVNSRLGVISNLANSSASVAPILTQMAGQKGASLSAIGSLMSTAGSLASVYGGLKPALKTSNTIKPREIGLVN